MTFALNTEPFARFADVLESPGVSRDALSNAGEELRTLIDLTFEAEASPWGDPWADLDPRTLKARRGATAAILQDTGALRGSIDASPAQGDSLELGSYGIAYAATHQFGRDAIPARPFMPIRGDAVDLPSDWQEDVSAAFADAYEAALS